MNRKLAIGLAALLLTLGACRPPPQDTGQVTPQPSRARTLLSQSVAPAPSVQVNGQPLTTGVTLRPGDTITITLPAAPPVVITPPPAPLPLPLPAPEAAGTWAPLATESRPFTLATPSRVRYGLGDTWNVKDGLVGTLTCGNGTFGDPAIGKTKVCELFVPQGTAVVPPVVVPQPYDAPLTITRGGTYSGRWASTDPSIPAVTVKTSEPVILENCAVKGPGHLISARWVQTRLTVRGCTGDDTSDAVAGRFLAVEGAVALVVQDNILNRTGGIYLNSMDKSAAENRLEITGNRAFDVSGLKAGGKEYVQFLQLNHVRGQSGLIAWNRVENRPGSAVEDVINLYDTSGRPGAPISVRRNLIIGAFGTPPESAYSGGGIMLGDGDGAELEAVQNTVIETSNYGIASAGGKNILIKGNAVLGLGKLNDATLLDADPDAGIYARNYSGSKTFDPATVNVVDNTVGWGRPNPNEPGRQWDYSVSAGTAAGNRSVVPTPALIARTHRSCWAAA
ncbi:Right-handed parallel beta-helix repeat-containing protein [Deinococcus saxicola]|uniref:hypothetical protein n=1 Tax=Deinococcus saxicola TaxID=249406 RepID=UPI0039EE054D